MGILQYVPPSRLRGLPSELVTREHADIGRVHENDPPHIVRGLIKKFSQGLVTPKDEGAAADKEAGAALGMRLRWSPEQGPLPITPYIIDILRMRTIIQMGKQIVKYSRMGVYKTRKELTDALQVHHLWFPENRASRMELRKGLAPRDKQRPSWLMGLDLTIDLLNWPGRMKAMLREQNINPEPILALLRKRAQGLMEPSPWLTLR